MLFADQQLDVNMTDENGTTLLMAAVKSQKEEFIMAVASRHPNLEASDKSGETALSYAVKNKNTFITTFLMGIGAKK